jgi:cell division septal protein FtsQ
MPPFEQPEDAANREASQPAGSMRDLTRQLSRSSDEAVELEPEPPAPGQSVFSSRSGIQDPLVKTSAGEEPVSPSQAEAPYCPLSDRPLKRGKKSKGKGKNKPPKSNHVTRPEAPAVKSRRQQERARRRQENYLQKRRKEKKLRVFYGRIRSILKLCCAFLWAFLLWEMVQSPLWVMDAPRYQVTHQQLLQPSQLAPLVQPWVGKPLYSIHTGTLAQQIEQRFAVVDRAEVRRVLFPASLRIQIIEKQPWAGLYLPSSYDKAHPAKPRQAQSSADSGKAASAKNQRPWWETPFGMAAESELIGLSGYAIKPALFASAEKVLVNPQVRFKPSYWRQLREVAWQARQIKGLHLEAVDIRNPNEVILRYQEMPVILGRLNDSASQRLARLIPLLPKMKEYHDVIEAVDLKWEEQVTFHKRPNAQLKEMKEPQVQG